MNRMLLLLAASAACVALVGAASGQAGTQATLRLSWETCDPQHADMMFTSPTTYKLVISASDFAPGPSSDDHVFTDILLAIAPVGGSGYSDAWRFDDSGCQTGGFVQLISNRLGPDCPALRGLNFATFESIGPFDPASNTLRMRLAICYDTVSPAPSTRYTIWQVIFDMTYAVVGPGTPGTSCGDADRAMRIWCEYANLGTLRGEEARFLTAPGDLDHVTWNMGPPVQAVAATWGRLKRLYR